MPVFTNVRANQPLQCVNRVVNRVTHSLAVVKREHPTRPLVKGGFFFSLHPALLLQAESVSSMLATTESCLSPIWIKRMNSFRPGGIPPQRNVGTAAVSGQRSQIRGSRFRVQSPTGSPGGRPGATTQAVTTGLHPDTLVQAQTPLLAGLTSPNSCETALHIEGLSRLQHVVARTRQLVHQRLGRHHAFFRPPCCRGRR